MDSQLSGALAVLKRCILFSNKLGASKMVGNMVRPVNIMSVSPLPLFICYEVVSLIRINVLYKTIMVDKAFCKFAMVILSKALCSEKANPFVEFMPVKPKHCFFYDRSGPV